MIKDGFKQGWTCLDPLEDNKNTVVCQCCPGKLKESLTMCVTKPGQGMAGIAALTHRVSSQWRHSCQEVWDGEIPASWQKGHKRRAKTPYLDRCRRFRKGVMSPRWLTGFHWLCGSSFHMLHQLRPLYKHRAKHFQASSGKGASPQKIQCTSICVHQQHSTSRWSVWA